MLYFYLACVALLFSGVIAQECSPVTAAWTQPRICNILYNTTTSAATNPALGDALSSFYSSLSPRPSESCAAAHAAYYCNKFYPECSADQTTALSTCLQACITLGEACSLDSDVAAFTGVTDYPIPASCTNPSPCSTPAPADLTSYYADCGEVELNTTLFGVQITNHIMCRPEYPVPESNITAANYAAATKVFNTFRQISSYLASLPEDVGMTDVIYPCVKYFSNFYCAKAFPSCGNNDALPIQPICASTCQLVVTNCSVWDELFDLSNTDLSIPTVDECNALPTTNCYSPINNTYVGFFFGDHDPPVPVEPTTTPTTSTTRRGTSGPDHDTPTGGYAKGGGIGAGVLIGLLLIIGITMFIMKKQDSR